MDKLLLLDEVSQVRGQIYIIRNKINSNVYIGQTRTHRKNRDKYRPFGYMKRFYDHISEALCNTKKKQCTYLNNAIRLYGKDFFDCELICDCDVNELDFLEQKYISEYNSLYPSGYNLTSGGKVFISQKLSVSNNNGTNTTTTRGGCSFRSNETRLRMSQSLKQLCNNPTYLEEQMQRSQRQHYKNKLIKFRGVSIDYSNIEQYIFIRKTFVQVRIGTLTTNFVGKFENIQSLREKAEKFIHDLKLSATLSNCSGNP